MDTINPFVLGIGSSVAAIIITSAVWWSWGRIKSRDRLLSFLKLSRSKGVIIFYGNIHREQLTKDKAIENRKYATFEYGDIASTLVVYDKVKSIAGPTVTHAVGTNYENLLRGNVISIGGPKWNKVTEKLLGDMGSPLYYSPDFSGIVEKRKLHSHENFHEPHINNKKGNKQTISDYGMIICARSEFLGKAIPFAMIIAGYSTYGVLIASEYLVGLPRIEIKRLEKRFHGDRRFGLLVRGLVEFDSSGHVVYVKQKELVSEIPAKDFLEPHEYRYTGLSVYEGVL